MGNRDKPSSVRLIQGQTCANESSNGLEQKERDIERKLLIAEKDKREAMFSLECIKKLTDQYQALIEDFQLIIPHEELKNEIIVPQHQHVPDTLTERRRNSIQCISGSPPLIRDENKSPNANIHSSLQENYEELLKCKEAELKRVCLRAQQEADKASFLRRKKDDLQQRIFAQVEIQKKAVNQMKRNVQLKEKEIARLSFLAEQDKKTGMFLSQQITQLKKSIEGFLQAREDSKPETLCTILTRCTSSSDFYASPPSSPLHSSSATSRISWASVKRTALGREMEALQLEDEKKSQELARVRTIVEQESKHVQILKVKVEELKQGLVAELQEADEQLEMKMQEFVQKQLAIEKVQARAERERARSLFLKTEIIKLSDGLGAGKESSSKKGKKSDEYAPDKAYLSEFSDLCDLETPIQVQSTQIATETSASDSSQPTVIASSDSNQHAISLPLSIATNLRARDPSMFVFSPPCRMIPISPASECIYMQKLKDIAVLNRETCKKDVELIRLKKVAEAERCRHLLLKDKFDQLRCEMQERQAYGGRTL